MKRIFQSKKSSSFEGDDDDNKNHDNDDDAWNPNNSSVMKPSKKGGLSSSSSTPQEDEFGMTTRAGRLGSSGGAISGTTTTTTTTTERPNYRGMSENNKSQPRRGRRHASNEEEEEDDDDEEEEEGEQMNMNLPMDHDDDDDEDEEDDDEFHQNKAEHIEKSAGTSRLNRILRDASTMSMTTTTVSTFGTKKDTTISSLLGNGTTTTTTATTMEKVSNPRNLDEVGHLVGRVVIPPLRVDPTTIGGHMLDTYPISMQQETLYVGMCHHFESTNTSSNTNIPGTNPSTTNTTTTTSDMIYMSTLQYPNEYSNRKRSLGLFSTTTTTSIGSKYRTSKIRYIIIGRSTNRPLLKTTRQRQMEVVRNKQQEMLQHQYIQDQRGGGNHNNHNTDDATNAAASSKNTNDGKGGKKMTDDSDRGDYDTMFAPDGIEEDNEEDEDDDTSRDVSSNDASHPNNNNNSDTKGDHSRRKSVKIAVDENENDDMDYNKETKMDGGSSAKRKSSTTTTFLMEEEEISSFPVLICMTLQNDGTGPDIRKLIPLDQLTTIQDLNSTTVQLAFGNGDTIRIDFGNGSHTTDGGGGGILLSESNTNDANHPFNAERKTGSHNNNISMERSLDKERFIWSVLQIHAMLCMSVVERNSRGTNFLLPLNVRNVDRAELQYIATINGFISHNETIRTLLERQRQLILDNETSIRMTGAAPTGSKQDETMNDADPHTESTSAPVLLDMDEMAYDLMMGNFATRVTLFHSEDERKDAEEILNSPEWTEMFNSCTLNPHHASTDSASGGVAVTTSSSAAMNVAERLTYILQSRMRDLEAETCRRLIAWEDEKHVSLSNKAKLHDASDSRDTVDALALASLFKTLESLDSELKAMEDWLQERAAAIKPLTDDCADIEEENRQLEQQWKSYDMLGNEMKRLLHGQELDETTETILKNPASVLVYDEDGLVNVDDSEDGIERLYEAGKALLDAIEFVRVTLSSFLFGVGAISNILLFCILLFSSLDHSPENVVVFISRPLLKERKV